MLLNPNWCDSITQIVAPQVAQPQTSGYADLMASLRDNLTGVANTFSQPLPPGLLERIESSRSSGEIDIALTDDIATYLTSARNKLPNDVTGTDSPVQDNSQDNPTGTTPPLSPLQKVMREAERVADQFTSFNKEKVMRETDRVFDQLKSFNKETLPRETDRVYDQFNSFDKEKLTRETERLVDDFKNIVEKVVNGCEKLENVNLDKIIKDEFKRLLSKW